MKTVCPPLPGLVAFGLALVWAWSAGGEPPGQWFRFCKTDQAATCSAKIALLPQGAPADRLLIVQVDASKPAVFIIGGHPGRSGLVQVDANPGTRTSRCDGATCAIVSPEAEKVLQQMRSGRDVTVEFVSDNGQKSGPFKATLAGFSTAVGSF